MKIKHDEQGPRFVHECVDCKPQHTPTPWFVESHSNFPDQKVIQAEKSRVIAVVDDNDETDKANAAFIVRAVNLFDAIGKRFPGLIDGETPVNGGDLVDFLTQAIAEGE